MKHFDTLGVMIDCSRNAVPNVEGLKRYFDTISKMGYNMAMLYTEDTYEVDDEPYFGYKRGRYSKEEIKELDAYAKTVGIELVPCVQTLAHLESILRWRAYRYRVGDIDDILLIDEPRTYTLIENMFKTLRETYTTDKIHIGMDEAHHVGLGAYLDRHGFTNRYELLLRHLNRVCEIAKKYGFEPMMWEDMFFNLASGKYYWNEEVNFPKEVIDKIPENCTMVYWDYYSVDPTHYDAMIKSSKKLSDKVWFAGGAWCWGTITPHNRYSMKRNELALHYCKKHGIRNIIMTMWGDDGGECAYPSVLPTLMHVSAIADDLTDAEMKAKFKEITGEAFDDFMQMDLPNYIYGEDIPLESPCYQNAACNYAKSQLYDDPFLGIQSVLLDNPDLNILKNYSNRLHAAAEKSKNYRSFYEAYACLTDVLQVKLPLATKTKQLYDEGKKTELRILAEEDYTKCIELVHTYYRAYRKLWYEVNKTYGFEIQDTRIGGLLCRLANCKERLLDYCNGGISEIAELKESRLSQIDTYVPSWKETFSANRT